MRRGPALPHLAASKGPDQGQVKDYAVPFDRTSFPTRAVLKLSSPRIGPSGKIGFCHHPLNADGSPSRTVVAVADTSAYESHDLGETWKAYPLEGAEPVEHAFVTSTGHKLVATFAAASPGDAHTRVVIRRYSPDWKPAGEPLETVSAWHGSCAIGEKDGVILFAEYPVNRGKYGNAEKLPLTDQLVSDPRVFRSRDDGKTWDVCFQVSAEQVRHLHTVAPDPTRPRRWWLTSGDRAAEVFVWVSDDDGDTWRDITATETVGPLHRNCNPRAVQRLTDQVFHDGWVIWGADDWLGNVGDWDNGDHPRVGSRIFKARADGPWIPEEIGFCGPPIRSIVDVGPAWLFISEAKAKAVTYRPESWLVFKDELNRVHRFVQFDNWAEASTGFTYSRASRKALDGVFFSFRGVRDVFARGPRLLRWEIAFF
ncbi:MAG: hypothetical protein K1X35_07100 [Caulobacteraceae bacterium]|nr:hypothetical protein [Caulobacteraceae bacterium]